MTHDIILADMLKYAFGMNQVANQVARIKQNNQSFPPYSIYADSMDNPTKFILEIAVAGFSKNDITTKVVKDNGVSILVIEGEKQQPSREGYESQLVGGLAYRNFRREFTLANTKVDSVSLDSGILTIRLSNDELLKNETLLQIE